MDDILRTRLALRESKDIADLPVYHAESKFSLRHKVPASPGIYYQSEQIDRYRSALQELRACGRLYSSNASRQFANQRLSDRDCLYGPRWEQGLENPQRQWWIRTEPGDGPDDDYAVRRKGEGGKAPLPSFHLASLVDDRILGITHIVRGDDLRPSTAIQLHLNGLVPGREQDAFRRIHWVHHPLLLAVNGKKMSKSAGQEGQSLLEKNTPQQIIKNVKQVAASQLKIPANSLWLNLLESEADRIDAIS
jgi:glutamyl-tRNA synthetase